MRSVPTRDAGQLGDLSDPELLHAGVYTDGRLRLTRGSGVRSDAMAVILLTGATGYVGGRLLPFCSNGGTTSVPRARPGRRRSPTARSRQGRRRLRRGPRRGADGADVAYYLIHSMGGGGGGFADRDEQAARNFARARAGRRAAVVYLGGLPSNNGHDSEHLRVAAPHRQGLGAEGRRSRTPARPWCSARLVVVHMLQSSCTACRSWSPRAGSDPKSQPIAIADVVTALAALGEREDVTGDVHLGGADVLTYRDMMRRLPRSRAGGARDGPHAVPLAEAVLLLGAAHHARPTAGWFARSSTGYAPRWWCRRLRRPASTTTRSASTRPSGGR